MQINPFSACGRARNDHIYNISFINGLNTNVPLKNPHLEAFSKHLQCFFYLGLELYTVILTKGDLLISNFIHYVFPICFNMVCIDMHVYHKALDLRTK